jgi:hypothetical protein
MLPAAMRFENADASTAMTQSVCPSNLRRTSPCPLSSSLLRKFGGIKRFLPIDCVPPACTLKTPNTD